MNFEAEMEKTPLTPKRLAKLHALATERAPSDVEAATNAKPPSDLFYALPSAAIGAYRLGKSAEARMFAEQCLALAPEYKDDWNYGNAIHFAHATFGLLALEQEDVETAVEQLKLSGSTPGSPQLNSFGPTMQLARELLLRGQFVAVLDYLKQCHTFWEMGAASLNVWEAKIEAREIPNFTMNLYR